MRRCQKAEAGKGLTPTGGAAVTGPKPGAGARATRAGSEGRQKAACEARLHRLTTGVQGRFPGYLGAEVHHPGATGGGCRSVFRFDGLDHLDAFERSDFRAAMLAEAASAFAADAARDRLTGPEFWFDPRPEPACRSPHRMALAVVAVVFVLEPAPNLTPRPPMAGWPLPLRVPVTVRIRVALVTCVIMPRPTPRIAGFIHPESATL